MGTCWNCGTEVILKEDETRCSRCKKIVRYWCWSCKQPFDVEEKKDKKRLIECKWCQPRFFKCLHCGACSPSCPKSNHELEIKKFIKPLNIPIDKFGDLDLIVNQILLYFEDVKLSTEQTNCALGVPKTYAKDKIKSVLARMDGFRIRDETDKSAFEKRFEEILFQPLGKELTVNQVRDAGTYGQEYRDVFNLSICLGKLKYEKKTFKGVDYDSWNRIEEKECPYLDTEELIVKTCKKCKEVFTRDRTNCPNCVYKQNTKHHNPGEHFELHESLSNNPTCKNLGGFKKRYGKKGESKFEGDN